MEGLNQGFDGWDSFGFDWCQFQALAATTTQVKAKPLGSSPYARGGVRAAANSVRDHLPGDLG